MLKQDNTYRQLTEKIVKVPASVQDVIPIHRISENGIFEIEAREGVHLFDKMYLFEDINYSTQDEAEKNQTLSSFKKLLNTMNVSFKICIMNHYSSDETLKKSIFRRVVNPEYKALGKEYHALLEQRLKEGRKGLQQSRYFIISCKKADYSTAKNYFETIETTIAQMFKIMGSILVPLNAAERLRSLHSFYRMGKEETFSFDWDEYLALRRDWRNDIINTSMRFRKNHIEMDDDKAACAMFVRKYASGLSDAFMNEVTNLSFPVIFTMDCEPMDNDYAYHMVMKKYTGNESSILKQQEAKNKNNDYSTDISYEKRRKKEEAEEILDDLRSFDERLFYVGIYILFQADTMEELEQRKEEVELIGRTHNMEIVPHSYRQMEAMNTALPTAARFVNIMRSLKTDSLSIFTPFNVQEISHPEAFNYGVNQVSKKLILGNRKVLEKNANGFVFSPSGGGKSMGMKFEMGQVLAFTSDDIIVIDPMGEYRGMADKWNGQYYNLSQSKENVFYCNPFHVPECVEDETKFIAEKAEFAYAICEKALKPVPMTNRHVSIIDRAVRDMYVEYFEMIRKKGGYPSPTLSVMREKMEKYKDENNGLLVQELIDSLEVFSDGTLNIFAREQSQSRENRFKVFGFPDLGKRMCEMAMLVMMETITNTIKYNQAKNVATWVYIDEIHRIWDDEYSLVSVEKMWREVRKRGGICTGMSQSVIDGLQNRATKTMVSNSEFTMLLDQGVVDKSVVSELFRVSDAMLEYVNGAKPGTGLIRFGKKVVPFDNSIPEESSLYRLYNTDFHKKAENT